MADVRVVRRRFTAAEPNEGRSEGERGDSGPTGVRGLRRAEPIDEAAVRSGLSRVLESAGFRSARRARALLIHLVEEALAGRGAAVCEHSVAQDVFQRDATFDPSIDSCVRTETWRLRVRLRNFYAQEGRDESIRIGFAPRSMALEFKRDGVSDEGTTNGSRVVVEVAAEAGAHGYSDSFTVHLAEEIARGLKQVPSVRPYLDEKGATSAEFRVRAHVRSEAGQLRLTASLLDEATGEVRAAESFSRPTESTPFSPAQIGQAVVQMTADSLAGRNVDLPVDLLDPMDRCRYVDVVLRGSFADRSRRLAELKASINYYERLTSQDRTDIFAHRRHVGALGLFLIMAPSATLHVLPKLVAAGEAALALDSALPDVWQTIGLAHSYAYDWAAAETSYRAAISDDPLCTSSYVFLAHSYLQNGRIDKALQAAEAAVQLDPWSPAAASSYALALNHARRFSDAATVASRALAVDPKFPRLRMLLADSMMQSGALDSAVEELQLAQAELWQDTQACGLLGLAYAQAGEHRQAQSLLSDLEHSHTLYPRDASAEAMIHIGLGSTDHALESLSQAVRHRGTPGLFFTSASFDPIRSTRRFGALQRQMGALAQ